ncbi:MAG: hypothetical protein IJZ10_07290, partial [Thermoguttaceae bacterium]|nr:hypothetical protein [Thermoguttaceae bacterium]
DKAAAEKAAADKAAAEKAAAEKAAAEKAAAEKAAAEKAAQEAAAKAAAAKADAEKAAKAAEEARRFAVGDSGAYMSVVPMKKFSAWTAQTLLYASVPGVDVTVDSSTSSLIIYGSKTNVEAAIALVERMEKNLDVVLEIVDVTKELPAEVVTALPRLEPRVTATYDRTNKRFLLYGRPADVARLKAYIAQIQTATTDEIDGVYYLDVERNVPGELQDYARKAVPGAEITFDSASRRFTIIGTPTEQLAATKILVDAVANLPAEDETRYYRFETQVPERMIDMLRERVKGVKEIARDENNSAILRVVAKPFQHEEFAAAIEKVKAEYPFADENTFVSYPITDEVRARFEQVRDDFVKTNGSIRILTDDNTDVMSVWALPSQHAALKKLLGELGSLEEPVKETATLYRPKYVDAATLVSLLKDLHKDVTVVNDTANRRLTMRGKPADLEEAKATLAAIDVKNEDGVVRTYKSYPIKGFYNYDGVGNYYSPTYYLRELTALVPAAKVTYDYYNQALVVWGTEEEHALIQEAVSNLMQKDGLDNRMSRWQVRRAAYSTLLSSIRSTVPGATVTYESASKSIIISAKNKETLEEVRELLELLDPEEVSDFDPILSYYDVGANPSDELVDALEELVPNAARIEIDEKNKQLLVIAKPAEHKIVAANVANLAKTYGSSDKRMVPYPVYGMEIDALVDSLTDAYPTATVEADERGGRVIVRATLDDHVKISEEIEKINASEVDADDPNSAFVPGPRVSVYTVKTPQIATQLRGVVAQLFPSAEVFAGTGYAPAGTEQKIVVLANGREQKMIADVVEELTAPSDDENLDFAVYPFGNVAPETVESLVENLIPDAIFVPTLTGNSAAARSTFMQGRQQSRQSRMQRMWRGGGASPNQAVPFYRVDPTDKTLALFANAEDHEAVKDAVGKLATLAGDEAKVTSKVKRLENPIAYSILPAFAQIFPAITATPTGAYELILYGPEAELAKTDAFFEGFNERPGQMHLITLPAESRYLRDRMVNIIRTNFAPNGITVYPGANSDQLIIWGPEPLFERLDQFVAEICKTPDESAYKTFPVVHTTVPAAVAFLAKVCPNAEITPEPARNQIVVYGSPDQLTAVENALKALDVPTDVSVQRVVRGYTWPYAGSFWKTYSEVSATFPYPQAIMSQSTDFSEIIVTATEEVQAEVAAYVEARRVEAEKKAPSLKAYYLTRVNFTKLVQIAPTVVPGVAIYPGKGANEVFVVATEINHEKFLQTLTRLETIPEGADVDGLEPKIYQVSPQGATAAIGLLTPQIPGAVMYPLSGSRLVVWGSVSDHERVAKALEVVGEAFPNVTLKKYPLVHLRFADVVGFMTTRFPTNEAYFYPSSDGSLMCQAAEVVQAQVVELLASLDVEDGPESKIVPRAYDISDIPVASHVYVAQALTRMAPEAIQLPTSTPGFLVVSARPSVHKKIEEHIAELLKERPNANKTLVAYNLRRMTLAQLSAMILPLYPNVKIGVGTAPNQVVILAKEDEHAKIASIIEQLENSTDGMSTVIYRLQYATPATARLAILAVYPTASIVADPTARTLTVKTYVDEQVAIAEFIKQLDDADDGKTTEVYRLQYATPALARASILALYPTALIVPDAVARTITVKTVPGDQPKIAELVKKLDNADDGKTTQIYRLEYSTPASVRAALIAAYPTATIIPDALGRTVTVKTVPGDQEKIAQMIETLDDGDDGTTAIVYRLKNSQLSIARQAILAMYPQADVVIDQLSRSVMVKAYEDDHKKIAQLIKEIDERDPERNTSFKIFNIGSLDFRRLLAPLRNFYANDVAFQAQLDTDSQCLIVRGTAIQHEAVEKLIEEARQGGLADPESYMQSYTIQNSSVRTSLYSLFYEQGRDVNMYTDYSTGKLIVVGRPEEHKMVLDVLDVLEPEKTELAIFNLVYVDPSTARQAFGMIETEGAYSDVRYDANTNRLFARSTPAMLEKMRQVLIQMGEKDLEKMKPFVDANERSGSSTNDRRIYLRERQESTDAAPSSERVDLKNLEPLAPAPEAAQPAVEPAPEAAQPAVEPAPEVAQPAVEPAPEAAQPAVEPSVQVEATQAGRVVTIQGANAAEVVDAAVRRWTRENQVKVLVGDGGIVQEKPTVAPTQPAPAPEAAPAKPAEPTAEEKAAAEKAAAEKAVAEKAAAEKAAAEKAA